ncbi:hypothetical protein SAMN05661080_02265 [Modestobacter sp. DSM 44400]|uniref:hypothetical protein n=1 Tax=Modestobacter sp. DSM 44400 TaxID=1550230 RepID=UPI000896D7EE|nr:hypothetical protein [Modestobacter sp. DSM 44400]SDY08513.1 hypothetical protein SAMN05661080_02265 [Modestobacter sp. DSM 44400]
MTHQAQPAEDRESRFRELPVPVRLEDMVESVDTGRLPERDLDAERDQLLRAAGG